MSAKDVQMLHSCTPFDKASDAQRQEAIAKVLQEITKIDPSEIQAIAISIKCIELADSVAGFAGSRIECIESMLALVIKVLETDPSDTFKNALRKLLKDI